MLPQERRRTRDSKPSLLSPSSTRYMHISRRGRKGSLKKQRGRSEEHTSELQSLMRISYAVFCLKKKTNSLTSINTLSRLQQTHLNQRKKTYQLTKHIKYIHTK